MASIGKTGIVNQTRYVRFSSANLCFSAMLESDSRRLRRWRNSAGEQVALKSHIAGLIDENVHRSVPPLVLRLHWKASVPPLVLRLHWKASVPPLALRLHWKASVPPLAAGIHTPTSETQPTLA